MQLAINHVLVAPPIDEKDERPVRLTVVDYQYGSDIVVLCHQDRSRPKKPFVHIVGKAVEVHHRGVKCKFDWDDFEIKHQNFLASDHIRHYQELWMTHSIPSTDIEIIENFFKRRSKLEKKVNDKLRVIESFEQIAQRKAAFFNGKLPTKSLKAFAKSLGFKYDFVFDTLSIFYAFGQCEESLIPAYGNCGRNASTPKNNTHARLLYPTGRGRPRKVNNELKRTSTEEDTKNVEDFYKKVLPSVRYFSMKNLTKIFNSEYATKLIYEDESGRRIYDYIPEKYLTTSQFKSELRKVCGSSAAFERIKLGAKEFRNKFKLQTSTVLKYVVAPSHMYEIDATVLDVHPISKYCKDEVLPIERPILYTVVDVCTSCIVGFHLSLNGANVESVTLALFNAMSDKEEFCKQWGYDYQEGDWPCHHVCHSLVIDRGAEYLDAAMERAITAKIGIASVQVTEAYLGRAKGSVEGLFNKLNKSGIHALPGGLLKGQPKAKSDTSNQARLTIDDLYYILIDEIIAHNNNTVVAKKSTQEHLANGINPIPRELWNWGIKELADGGRVENPKELMAALLPRKKASVSKEGVTLLKEKITYQTSNRHSAPN